MRTVGVDARTLSERGLLVDVAFRTVVGVAIGIAIGWLLCHIAFRPPGPTTALSEASAGFVGIAAMLLAGVAP